MVTLAEHTNRSLLLTKVVKVGIWREIERRRKKKQNGKCTHIWKTTQFIKQFLLLLFFWWSLFRNPNYDSYFNGLDRGSERHEISCVKAKIEDNRYGFKKIFLGEILVQSWKVIKFTRQISSVYLTRQYVSISIKDQYIVQKSNVQSKCYKGWVKNRTCGNSNLGNLSTSVS